MSLDALAPDQRAVVQLVLQQDRSYDELAGLLGISADAVRERAQRGLERLAPGSDLPAHERADIADYLLGQQSVSGRSATRSLLAGSAPARSWARAVADELRDIAGERLPEIPAEAAPQRAAPGPLPETPVAGSAPGGAGVAASGGAPEAPAPAARPVRARPRPRADSRAAEAPDAPPLEDQATARAPRPASEDRDRDAGASDRPERDGQAPRSNRLGGALLIGGLALVLVAVVLLLANRGDDGGSQTADATATPTATATPEFQPLGQIELTAAGGGDAAGQMVIFASQDGGVAFTIQAEDVPRSRQGEAYAVWLTGGDRPRRLGFAPTVGGDGRFGTSGPRENDRRRFASWFAEADAVVVSRETSEDAAEPGPVVLRGTIPQDGAGSGEDAGGG